MAVLRQVSVPVSYLAWPAKCCAVLKAVLEVFTFPLLPHLRPCDSSVSQARTPQQAYLRSAGSVLLLLCTEKRLTPNQETYSLNIHLL